MDERPAVLDGIRVVDCSEGIAGPLAAMYLTDFGADVVRLEKPAASADATGDPGAAVWNRGKRALAVDVSSTAGRAVLERLLAGADVCVVSGTNEWLQTAGLDLESLAGANPRLVLLHVAPYTGTAPWAGGRESDSLLAATTGVAARQASFEDVPVDSIYPHLSTVQGTWAAAAVVSALLERERSGLGQQVTVTGIHATMVASPPAFNIDPTAPEAPPRRSTGPGGAVPFYRTYQCGDGEWLFMAALTPRFSAMAFEALELTHLNDDERIGGRGRAGMIAPENAGWVIEAIADKFRTRPRSEWLERLAQAGCPSGPLLDRDDWLDHPQLDVIGMRVEVDDPQRGPVVMPGIPITLTASPGRVRGAAAMPAGTEEVPDWPATEPGSGERSHADGSGGGGGGTNGPLDGIRVLDLGAIIAGPFAATLLAELGADVIKVEPLTGDSFRGPGFAAYNKGQRGIALDLYHPDGKAAFLDLARDADIVLDNYRPGVLGRLGIAYDDLRAVNPAIITLSVTGFGEGGPLGGDAGFDPVLQAMSGMMRAQGGGDEPVFFTVAVNDVCAAANSALAACLALLHRARTGQGQRVWTSLAAMSAMLQASPLVRWEGRPPAPVGGRDHPGPSALDRFFASADGWVRVQADADAGPAVVEVLAMLGELAGAEAVERLTTLGVPAVVARKGPDLALDQELVDLGVLVPDARPERAHWLTTGRHAWFSRTERKDTLTAPSLGEHTREVLLEAGFDAARVEALVADRAAIAGAEGRP